MPIIKSAIKKVRVDKRRTLINLKVKKALKEAVDKARKKPTPANISAAARMLSMASKKKAIHRNKASRILSRLAHKSA